MIKRLHDGDFAAHIEGKFIGLDIRLVQDLDSVFDTSLLVLGKLDFAESALSEGGRDDILKRIMSARTFA